MQRITYHRVKGCTNSGSLHDSPALQNTLRRWHILMNKHQLNVSCLTIAHSVRLPKFCAPTYPVRRQQWKCRLRSKKRDTQHVDPSDQTPSSENNEGAQIDRGLSQESIRTGVNRRRACESARPRVSRHASPALSPPLPTTPTFLPLLTLPPWITTVDLQYRHSTAVVGPP